MGNSLSLPISPHHSPLILYYVILSEVKRSRRISSLCVRCQRCALRGDPSATLGMTYYTNIHASQTPHFSVFTFNFSPLTCFCCIVAKHREMQQWNSNESPQQGDPLLITNYSLLINKLPAVHKKKKRMENPPSVFFFRGECNLLPHPTHNTIETCSISCTWMLPRLIQSTSCDPLRDVQPIPYGHWQ